jgi:hypothetical protein
MKNPIFLLFLMLAALTACQKDGNIAPDPTRVAISLVSPVPQQVYHPGDTVFIRGKLVYPGQLHGYELQLTDSATGMILFDVASHVHTDSTAIQEQWVSKAPDPMTVRLRLSAIIDHEGTEADTTLFFKVSP